MNGFKLSFIRTIFAAILITLLSGCVSAYSPPLFHKSAEKGDIKAIAELLNQREDVNQKDSYGFTPLHYAASASQDNTETVRILIDHGADINAKGPSGYSALAMAALRGNAGIAKLLIEKGAHIDDAIEQLKGSNNPHAQTGLKMLRESGYFWLGAANYRNQEYQKAIHTFEHGIFRLISCSGSAGCSHNRGEKRDRPSA